MAEEPLAQDYDPEAGRRAFEQQRAEYDGLNAAEVVPPYGDIDYGAAALLMVSKRAQGMLVDLKKLGTFDTTQVNKLPNSIWATWYARKRQQDAQATGTGPTISAALLDEATQRRNRMFKACEYNLADDEAASKIIVSIRAGTGFNDLASDLVRLSELYASHKSELQIDARNYDPADEAAARRDAQAVLAAAGEKGQSDGVDWTDYVARAWTVLARTYDEVRAAALYVGRGQPGIERQFPPLATVTRRPPTRKPEPVAATAPA